MKREEQSRLVLERTNLPLVVPTGMPTPLPPLEFLLLLLVLEIGKLLVLESGLRRVENHGTQLRLQKAGIISRSRMCEWSVDAVFAL